METSDAIVMLSYGTFLRIVIYYAMHPALVSKYIISTLIIAAVLSGAGLLFYSPAGVLYGIGFALFWTIAFASFAADHRRNKKIINSIKDEFDK